MIENMCYLVSQITESHFLMISLCNDIFLVENSAVNPVEPVLAATTFIVSLNGMKDSLT